MNDCQCTECECASVQECIETNCDCEYCQN